MTQSIKGKINSQWTITQIDLAPRVSELFVFQIITKLTVVII